MVNQRYAGDDNPMGQAPACTAGRRGIYITCGAGTHSGPPLHVWHTYVPHELSAKDFNAPRACILCVLGAMSRLQAKKAWVARKNGKHIACRSLTLPATMVHF